MALMTNGKKKQRGIWKVCTNRNKNIEKDNKRKVSTGISLPDQSRYKADNLGQNIKVKKFSVEEKCKGKVHEKWIADELKNNGRKNTCSC